MAITLYFYHFSKRKNSTLTPLETEYMFTETEVVLRRATSIRNPTFIINDSNISVDGLILSNYIRWDDRYYWVTNIEIITDHIVEFDCRIDSLATYKDIFLQQSQFILRSSSNGSVYNPDNLITFKNNNVYRYSTVSLEDVFTSDPLRIIEIANNQGTTFDTPYAITAAECNYLKGELYNESFLDYIKTWFSNPMESIIRIQRSAWNCGNLDDIGPFEQIYVGTYAFNTHGRRFYTHKVVEYEKTITIPWIYNDFRRQSPYTELNMYLPFVGIVSLDPTILSEFSIIKVEIKIEIVTGNIIYMLSYDFGEGYNKFAIYNGNCNSYEPFGQIKPSDPISMIPAATTVVYGIATKNPMMVGVGIAQSIESMQQHSIINGNISTALSANLPHAIQLVCISKESNAEPSDIQEKYGNPVNDMVRLSNLSGYCQCQNASVALPTDEIIVEEVNNYLNGGFYIE